MSESSYNKNWFGKRFGKLIVIKYVGKQKGVHYWKCKCDCGKETIVSQTNLQNGHTKSCGCLQTESGIKNLKLIEGTSISKLEATNKRLYKTNTSGFNGVYYAKKTVNGLHRSLLREKHIIWGNLIISKKL